MSQFINYGSASAAGGGGEESQSLSQSSDNSTRSSISSLGFSQPYFDEKGNPNPEYTGLSNPVFVFQDNDSVTLTPSQQVISGKVSLGQFVADSVASPFAMRTNTSIASLQHKTQDIIDRACNEDDIATELSTGLTKTINDGSLVKNQIYIAAEQYKTEISAIASNTIDVPSLSQDTTKTQNSASTQSALTVLTKLVTPEVINQLVTSVLSKKKVAPEGVDLTVTKCFYKSTSVEEILKENNRFGILKFASANGISISGQIRNNRTGVIIEMIRQQEKIYYLIKELEWMLEQDPGGATTKGSTRQFRFDALLHCLHHPLAIRLFDIIYTILCASAPNAHIKVCAVGGNVLRAFFLGLRWARNVVNGVPNQAPDDTCAAFNGWSPEQIRILGEFSVTVPNLDFLCNKSSDTDLTLLKYVHGTNKQPMEHALNLLCLPQEDRADTYVELTGKKPTMLALKCEGPTEFPLIRLKTPIFENGAHYETTCGNIENASETMKWANYYFHEIKWFAQMIPDDPVAALDALFETKKATYPKLVEIYPEIRKLYCTLQEVKKHNAVLTSLNSDVISQGSFTKLIEFTRECCQIFFDAINPNLTEMDDLQNIQQIVQKITPPASDAMFSILENPVTKPFIYRVLETLNNGEYLSSPEFLEKYKTNVRILTDVTGNPMPVKSTCIAVSSIVGGVSEIHKTCSAKIRHLFSELNPEDPFNRNLNITINCLKFMESNRSIEDIKDAGEQPIVAVEQPKETKSQTKTLRPSTLKNSQEPPKTKKTKGELTSIIQKYNEGKPNNEKITGYSRMQISQLLRLMVNRGLIKQGGGAKTRKQKNRKTRKRGMRKTRR
jgi:hypothetical protein